MSVVVKLHGSVGTASDAATPSGWLYWRTATKAETDGAAATRRSNASSETAEADSSRPSAQDTRIRPRGCRGPTTARTPR